MRHWSAAFVLVVAFSNLSYGHPADTVDPADAANNAGSVDAVTTLSAITKDKFLQKMESSEPYWTLMTSYQDPTQTQKRTCISTEEAEDSGVDGDTVFVQKYKFKGCHWLTYTHDAYYNVTFQDTSSSTDDLRMQWVPIPHATPRSTTTGKVYGTKRDYSFKYWDEKEGCFVLAFNSAEDKKECELLVWDSELAAKADTQKKETIVVGSFEECKKKYKTECPDASEEILFDKYCKITDAEFLTILTNSPGEIDTSLCSESSQ